MNIHQITFSPTGGTRRVSELLCKGITDKSHTTELYTKEKDFIPPSIATDDLAVISMPVYAGRVPALAVERLKKSNQAAPSASSLPFTATGLTKMPWWKCKTLQRKLAFRL